MTDYTNSNETHCVKNCFSCPECESMLSIRVKDDMVEDRKGKKFCFTCTFCDYSYNSEVILKPKSVWNIVKDEHTKSVKDVISFNKAKSYYTNLLNLETLTDQTVRDLKLGKEVSSPKSLEHLKTYNLNIDNADDTDKLKYLIDHMEFEKDEYQNEPHQNSGVSILQNPFPVPRKLITRETMKCCDCSQVLQLPNEEMISTKFICKFTASDYIPTINISPMINHSWPTWQKGNFTLLVNIINPLRSSVTVTLSSPSSVTTGNGTINTTIPVSEITIGPYNDKDHPIRSIPTPFLTKSTKLSRAEIVMRTGRIGAQSTNQIESLIEKSDNWGCLPIELTLEDTCDIRIPIHVSVKTKLPDAIKSLKLSRPELLFGFWTVIELPCNRD
ncbi:hypothetical protein CLIB1444_08S03730 [[Candida] jaroonii]|uniref:Uncharacterized protein n=1 Tax=[Candida] jaroonii TaxID=467808 RepID=A0ACA9YC46_9ASCO|nr:hypothetical protein CLIB1444_08S03730 [[Candida] jaroonii]